MAGERSGMDVRRSRGRLVSANIALAAFLVVSGPSAAVAVADSGGSNGGGNHSSGGAGNGPSANSGNSGNGTSAGGPAARSKPGNKTSVPGQTNSGSASKANGNNGNGNGKNGGGDSSSAQFGGVSSGSGNPVAPVTTPSSMPPLPVVVAQQNAGSVPVETTAAPAEAPVVAATPPAEPAPALEPVRDDVIADLTTIEHALIPVGAAMQSHGLRGDLFGLVGLGLMPLVGFAVGYRQAKAARDADLVIGS